MGGRISVLGGGTGGVGDNKGDRMRIMGGRSMGGRIKIKGGMTMVLGGRIRITSGTVRSGGGLCL